MKKLNFAKKVLALFVVFASVLTMAFAMSLEYSVQVSDVGESFNMTVNYSGGNETVIIPGNGDFDFSSSYTTPVSVTINGTTVNCGARGLITLSSGTIIEVDVRPPSHEGWARPDVVIIGNK